MTVPHVLPIGSAAFVDSAYWLMLKGSCMPHYDPPQHCRVEVTPCKGHADACGWHALAWAAVTAKLPREGPPHHLSS